MRVGDGVERLVVRLLGEPVLTFDGIPLKWTAPPKCLPLLALLALRRDDPMLRPLLATTLWPDDLESDARANLRRHLHRIVRALPAIDGAEWIAQSGTTIAWNAKAPAWLDVIAFEDAIEAGRLTEAVDAYRGDLLEGSYDESILAERERLRGTFLDALAQLMTAARAAREFAPAIAYAERLLEVDEWREDAVREWMSAKYESGDRSAALATYERFARRLKEEFGAQPMSETTALRDVIRSELPLPGAPEALLGHTDTDSAKRGWRLPFVGRSEAFDRLRALWQRAARGSGGVAFVSGEAGIGKSRLAAELVNLAKAQGGTVLIGTTSFPEGEPYQALVTAMRAGLAHVGRVASESAKLAMLASILPEVQALADDAGTDELPLNRSRLFDAAARLFELVARSRPLCVVLEDLHWAGPATIDMLASIARRIGTIPTLVVATYRSEEATSGAAVRALRASLVQERRAIALPLERLTPEYIAELVAASLANADASLVRAVSGLSEGNPLFVAQLIENYRETGALPAETTALRSIGGAIAARFEHLDANVRAVAQTAATIGEAFRADIVAEAGGWDENDVLDALGHLMDRGLAREAGGALEYIFSHALFRAAFYDESSADLKLARHRRIANIFERTGTSDVATLAATARYGKGAGDGERAAGAFLRAGAAPLDVYAREEAVAFAEAAEALSSSWKTRFDAMHAALMAQDSSASLDRRAEHLARFDEASLHLDDDARFIALRMRERYVQQIFDFDAAERVFADLDALAERTGTVRHRSYARFARGFGEMQRGALERSRTLLLAALEDAIAADDAFDISRVRVELIAVLIRTADWTSARRLLEAQYAMLEERNFRPEQRLGTLSCEGAIAQVLEDFEGLTRAGREMVDVGRRVGNAFIEAKGHLTLGQATALQFDTKAMREHFTIAGEGFAALREEAGAREALMTRAEAELRFGCIAGASELLDRVALTIAPENVDGSFCYKLRRARQHLFSNDAQRAAGEARGALADADRVGEPRFVPEAWMLLAAAEFRCENYGEAMDLARSAWQKAVELQSPAIAFEAASWLIASCVAAGKLDGARDAEAQLAAAFEAGRKDLIFPTLASNALAGLAGARGDAEERDRWLQRGRQKLEEISACLAGDREAAAFRGLFFNRGLEAVPAPG